MIELLQQHKWALMPSDTILERINELFLLNHENAPRHRLKFTDVSFVIGYSVHSSHTRTYSQDHSGQSRV